MLPIKKQSNVIASNWKINKSSSEIYQTSFIQIGKQSKLIDSNGKQSICVAFNEKIIKLYYFLFKNNQILFPTIEK